MRCEQLTSLSPEDVFFVFLQAVGSFVPGASGIPFQPVHLSSGALKTSPSPSNTLFSASSIVAGGPLPPPSRSTQSYGYLRDLMPLLSNLRFLSFLQYLRRSRWKVVSDVQPSTAQPTVFHGLMRMSTLRWGFVFLGSAAVGSNLGSCQTTRALSRVSNPVPPDGDGLKLVGLWPRSLLWVLKVSVWAENP